MPESVARGVEACVDVFVYVDVEARLWNIRSYACLALPERNESNVAMRPASLEPRIPSKFDILCCELL